MTSPIPRQQISLGAELKIQALDHTDKRKLPSSGESVTDPRFFLQRCQSRFGQVSADTVYSSKDSNDGMSRRFAQTASLGQKQPVRLRNQRQRRPEERPARMPSLCKTNHHSRCNVLQVNSSWNILGIRDTDGIPEMVDRMAQTAQSSRLLWICLLYTSRCV